MSSKKDNVKNSKRNKPETKKPPKQTTSEGNQIGTKKPSTESKGEVKPSETKEISINTKEAKEKEEETRQNQLGKAQPQKETPNEQLLPQNNTDQLVVGGINAHQHDANKGSNEIEKNNNEGKEEVEEEEYEEDEIPEAEDHSNHIPKEIKEDLAIKPREDYLKAKIEEMNMSKDILLGISKGLNSSIMSIKDGFITSQLRNISIKKNETDYLQHDYKKNSKSNVVRLHCIKELKRNEASLMNNIFQLSQNQTVLENESLLNLSIASAMNPIEETVKKNRIQKIKNTKELFKNRLEEIKYKIDSLVHKENIEEGKYNQLIKDKLHKFEANFEKDKALSKKKIKQLQKESIIRQQKMSNELGEKYELRANKIEHREKEEEQKKMVFIEQLRQQEKEAILKRSQMNKEKYIKMKAYINNKFQPKSYAYLDLSMKYADNEKQLIEREKIK